jgi:hypothetical protein
VLLAYLGSDTRMYLQYADAATGRTLEVTPGGTYDVRTRDPGLPLPPGDGRWGPASPPALTALAVTAPDPEPAAHDDEPETDPPQMSALPALPGTGDGDQPAADTTEE